MSKYIGTPVVNVSVDTVDVTGDITTTDSTPEVIIVNNTHEDTDGGREGKVTFKGQQSGGEETTLAQIQASHDGTSDDQKGDMIFKTNDGSDGASPTEAMRIDSGQNVGIGATSINRKLEISGNNNGGAKANYIRITDSDTTATASNQMGGIEFFSSDSSGGAGISASIETVYAGSGGGGELTFNTNATSGGTLTERMRIDESGKVGIGDTAPDNVLNIKESALSSRSASNGNTSMTLEHATDTGIQFFFSYTNAVTFW